MTCPCSSERSIYSVWHNMLWLMEFEIMWQTHLSRIFKWDCLICLCPLIFLPFTIRSLYPRKGMFFQLESWSGSKTSWDWVCSGEPRRATAYPQPSCEMKKGKMFVVASHWNTEILCCCSKNWWILLLSLDTTIYKYIKYQVVKILCGKTKQNKVNSNSLELEFAILLK